MAAVVEKAPVVDASIAGALVVEGVLVAGIVPVLKPVVSVGSDGVEAVVFATGSATMVGLDAASPLDANCLAWVAKLWAGTEAGAVRPALSVAAAVSRPARKEVYVAGVSPVVYAPLLVVVLVSGIELVVVEVAIVSTGAAKTRSITDCGASPYASPPAAMMLPTPAALVEAEDLVALDMVPVSAWLVCLPVFV